MRHSSLRTQTYTNTIKYISHKYVATKLSIIARSRKLITTKINWFIYVCHHALINNDFRQVRNGILPIHMSFARVIFVRCQISFLGIWRKTVFQYEYGMNDNLSQNVGHPWQTLTFYHIFRWNSHM